MPTCQFVSVPGDSTIDHEIELPVASIDNRASALVRLASDLRTLGRYVEALQALDIANALTPSAETECAIFTCAIAIHCDLDDLATAARLERDQARRSMDAEFARACARLYSQLYAATNEQEHRARRDAYRCVVASFDSI